MSEPKSSFKERIKELMDKEQVSQKEICEKADISQSSLSLYASGKRNPKQNTIYKIADSFSVNPSWLIGYDVPMYATPTENTHKNVVPFVKRTSSYINLLQLIENMNKDDINKLNEYANFLLSEKKRE